jgi:phosphoribosylamine--glycine ligase
LRSLASEFASESSTGSSPHKLYVVGGNPGIWELAQSVADLGPSYEDITETSADSIAKFAQEFEIDLVVVGPEAPLAAGVVDVLHTQVPDVSVFGPTKAAAELEASKSFAKEVMLAAGVPTALAVKCTDVSQLSDALDAKLAGPDADLPLVVKADGLAAGKGVIVTRSRDEATAHASDVFQTGGFVILEDFLDGPEFSQFFICDGKTAVPLQAAQDFKRIFDDDLGPNTGGMGAYTPLSWLPAGTDQWCLDNVAQPVVDEMAKRGIPFVGVLFAGLAYTSKGVSVIEFNVRFGDPETQVVLESLQSPLSGLLLSAARGELLEAPSVKAGLKWSKDFYCNVVLASAGYPESSHKGDRIDGIKAAVAKGAVVEHAGTAYSPSDIGATITNGGRVLSVIANAKDLKLAREKAYNYVKMISFDGMQNRSDIALKAVNGDISVG